MKQFCRFLRRFGRIHMSTTSGLIVSAIPLLLFILFHFIFFVTEDVAGGVVSNDRICAKIGRDILVEDGSVVDAAIGTMLCESVVLPNRAGIGGGFTAIMYIKGNFDTISATPVVPLQFPSGHISQNEADIEGAKAAGVPGELKGYWEMHKKYGLLSWRRLFEPTIQLCEKGIPITEWLESDMQRTPRFLYQEKAMWKLYQVLYKESDGKTFKFLTLAKTLRRIATEGIDVFYNGDIGQELIKDIRNEGGVMSEEDLRNYSVLWNSRPILFKLPANRKAFTTPLPSLGAVVAMTLNIVKGLKNTELPIFWHKTIEAMKFAYAHSYSLADIEHETDENFTNIVRSTYANMIDLDYARNIRKILKNNQTFNNTKYYGARYLPTSLRGSSNVCIISTNGDAIVMTSSLMWDFDTFFWSQSTGIYLNNQIRSFKNTPGDLPLSPGSIIRPGKRAISPHCPTIILRKTQGLVDMVLGASGSALVPTQVATHIILFGLLRSNAFIAVNSAFYHPDLMQNKLYVSDSVFIENAQDKEVFQYLKKVGHNLQIASNSKHYAIRNCIDHCHSKPNIQYTQHELGGAEVIAPSQHLSSFIIFVFVCGSFTIISMMIYEVGKIV